MECTQRFYDFCIPYNDNEQQLRAILTELVELGYKTIAIEQKYDFNKNIKKNNSNQQDIYPMPHNIEHLKTEYKHKLKILQRLTILYSDIDIEYSMKNSLNIKRFNLVAGQPKTDAALKHCCYNFVGDIITFDPTAGLRLIINAKAYNVAVGRKMFFEIKYAPALVDSDIRKDMIKLANNYSLKGKSKNVFLSSGATHEFQLRGPYDVAHLASIFGLSESRGKNAIDLTCRQLFLRGESRRIGFTCMLLRAKGPVCFKGSSDEDDEPGSKNNFDVETNKSDIVDDAVVDDTKSDDNGGDDTADVAKSDKDVDADTIVTAKIKEKIRRKSNILDSNETEVPANKKTKLEE